MTYEEKPDIAQMRYMEGIPRDPERHRRLKEDTRSILSSWESRRAPGVVTGVGEGTRGRILGKEQETPAGSVGIHPEFVTPTEATELVSLETLKVTPQVNVCNVLPT